MRYYLDLGMRLLLSFLLVFSRDFYASFITGFSAYISSIQLGLLFGATLEGNTISIASRHIEYVEACAAIGAYIFLGLLVLLTKQIHWKERVRIFLVGCLLILLGNILRIIILAYLYVSKDVNYFINLHYWTWMLLSGIYVALVWIFLVKYFKIKEIPLVSDYKELIKRIKK